MNIRLVRVNMTKVGKEIADNLYGAGMPFDESKVWGERLHIMGYTRSSGNFKHQRDLLATSLLNVLRRAGMLNSDTEPSGAELVMFAEQFCGHHKPSTADGEAVENILRVLVERVLKWHGSDFPESNKGMEIFSEVIEAKGELLSLISPPMEVVSEIPFKRTIIGNERSMPEGTVIWFITEKEKDQLSGATVDKREE